MLTGESKVMNHTLIGVLRPEFLETNYMKIRVLCGAYARTTGQSCQATALGNGRCKNHGGLSTGPKTEQGKQAIRMSNRQRKTNQTRSPDQEIKQS